MQIVTTRLDQTTILTVTGRMDVIAAMEYEKKIDECLQRGDQRFVVDLDTLEYISSAGLRSLLNSAKKIKATKCKLNFCNIRGAVKEVFALSGFDTILPVFNSLNDAIRG